MPLGRGYFYRGFFIKSRPLWKQKYGDQFLIMKDFMR